MISLRYFVAALGRRKKSACSSSLAESDSVHHSVIPSRSSFATEKISFLYDIHLCSCALQSDTKCLMMKLAAHNSPQMMSSCREKECIRTFKINKSIISIGFCLQSHLIMSTSDDRRAHENRLAYILCLLLFMGGN